MNLSETIIDTYKKKNSISEDNRRNNKKKLKETIKKDYSNKYYRIDKDRIYYIKEITGVFCDYIQSHDIHSLSIFTLGIQITNFESTLEIRKLNYHLEIHPNVLENEITKEDFDKIVGQYIAESLKK